MTGWATAQNTDCAPPLWEKYTQQANGWHIQFYSPAICPNGYTAACTRPRVGALGPEVEPSETAFMCLPT